MRDPGERPLSLRQWPVLCMACEKLTYGFAIAGLLSREGSLGQVWQVSKPAVYRAIARLEQLGLVQATGREPPTSARPAAWSPRPRLAAGPPGSGCARP